MICILAATYKQAERWATAQQLADDEWFCTLDQFDLYNRENFHVIVLDTASELPPILFERLFNMAQERGRRNRR